MAGSAKKVLGIIPARGGSKGIPGKNIKPFAGKPLIAWSIEALRESRVCDRIIVSTDDDGIAAVAKEYGAEVPFMRPHDLAGDDTPTLPVLAHAIQWLKDNENYQPDAVLLVQATSPGVKPVHFQESVELFFSSGADSVMSMIPVPSQYSPHWQFSMASDGRTALCTGEPVKQVIRRRQDLPDTFIRNGYFWIFKPSLLFGKEPSFYGDDVRGYPMDRKYDIDIDEPDDWVRAEKKFQELQNHGA